MSRLSQFHQAPGLHVEIYDQLTEQVFGARSNDAMFYLEQAKQFGDPVLELGAGTGRVSWTLAEAGITIVGLDLSEPMLSRAQAKGTATSPAARKHARFVQGDMTDFQLAQLFSLIIIPYRGFQTVISLQRQRQCLGCIHRHLQKGGRLIVDLFDPRLDLCMPEAAAPSNVESVRHPSSGNTVKIETVRLKTDPVAQLLTERWRFSEVNKAGKTLRVEEELLTMRWTYRTEMRYLLELTGFDVEHEFSDFLGSPPTYGKEQIWIARRL